MSRFALNVSRSTQRASQVVSEDGLKCCSRQENRAKKGVKEEKSRVNCLLDVAPDNWEGRCRGGGGCGVERRERGREKEGGCWLVDWLVEWIVGGFERHGEEDGNSNDEIIWVEKIRKG